MYEAAERAREGDVAYFRGLAPAELSHLIVGRDEDGRTLFHTAAANGHLELLELLAGSGATKVANKQDDEVRAVAVVAVDRNDAEGKWLPMPDGSRPQDLYDFDAVLIMYLSGIDLSLLMYCVCRAGLPSIQQSAQARRRL